jgi:hypothetical protein
MSGKGLIRAEEIENGLSLARMSFDGSLFAQERQSVGKEVLYEEAIIYLFFYGHFFDDGHRSMGTKWR